MNNSGYYEPDNPKQDEVEQKINKEAGRYNPAIKNIHKIDFAQLLIGEPPPQLSQINITGKPAPTIFPQSGFSEYV
jgi:hypothetical protein